MFVVFKDFIFVIFFLFLIFNICGGVMVFNGFSNLVFSLFLNFFLKVVSSGFFFVVDVWEFLVFF